MLQYLVEKEWKQIFRNPFLPKLILILPVVMLLVLPWAANQEVKNIALAVVDNDRSPLSTRLIRKIQASSHFHLAELSGSADPLAASGSAAFAPSSDHVARSAAPAATESPSPSPSSKDFFSENRIRPFVPALSATANPLAASGSAALAAVEAGRADLILEIPADFEKNLATSTPVTLLISANAVNSMKGGLGASYLSAILASFSAEFFSENGINASLSSAPADFFSGNGINAASSPTLSPSSDEFFSGNGVNSASSPTLASPSAEFFSGNGVNASLSSTISPSPDEFFSENGINASLSPTISPSSADFFSGNGINTSSSPTLSPSSAEFFSENGINASLSPTLSPSSGDFFSGNGINASLSPTISPSSDEFFSENGISSAFPPTIRLEPQYRFNAHLDYKAFMVPAIIVILLTLLCGFLPALNIVSEKEAGTIEQINVTPVNKFTFILAKLIPYWLIGFLVLSIGFGIAALVYQLFPAGSLFTLYLSSGVYVLVVSGLGLVISNYSDTLQQAMFVIFFFIMILILMSGLFTPLSSMPAWAQLLASLNPLKYFMQIMRAVYLRGSALADLTPQLASLLAFAFFFNGWAIMSYRKTR